MANHLEKCLKRRALEQESLPTGLRSAAPSPPNVPTPTEVDSADVFWCYNKAARAIADSASPICPKCRRTFFADRLVKHMKTCCPDTLTAIWPNWELAELATAFSPASPRQPGLGAGRAQDARGGPMTELSFKSGTGSAGSDVTDSNALTLDSMFR